MGAQPARKSVGATRNFSVEAASGDTSEVVKRLWMSEWCDSAEVNDADIVPSCFESLPCQEGVFYVVQLESASKVVAASSRDDEYWKLQFHEGGEMAVECAVSAEDGDGISVAVRCWEAEAPRCGGSRSKRVEGLWPTT